MRCESQKSRSRWTLSPRRCCRRRSPNRCLPLDLQPSDPCPSTSPKRRLPTALLFFVFAFSYDLSPLAHRAATKGRKGDRGGGAMDPVERIRFHVARARATNKLDLSTWANRRQGDFLLSRVPRTVSEGGRAVADRGIVCVVVACSTIDCVSVGHQVLCMASEQTAISRRRSPPPSAPPRAPTSRSGT